LKKKNIGEGWPEKKGTHNLPSRRKKCTGTPSTSEDTKKRSDDPQAGGEPTDH